jgi:hypothetical protein
MQGPYAIRTKDLLKLNTDQLKWVVGLFTWQCHLKGHLFLLRLTDDPTCERCLEEDESATHILCDCRAISNLIKISSLGPVLYGTKWLLWRHHNQSPTFQSKYRIDKGLTKRESTIDHWRSQCKGRIIVPHPYAFNHSTEVGDDFVTLWYGMWNKLLVIFL